LYVLPDAVCTPGATNPAVTQATITTTICASGWTATIRPPESYTEPIKVQQLAAYGESGSVGSYEEDHLIPLELGGAPRAVTNLWPEPGASPNPKDAVEDAAHRAVCAGTMGLTAAQQAVAEDWVAFGAQLGVTPSPAGAAPSTTVPAPAPLVPPPSAGVPAGNSRAGEFCPAADTGQTVTGAGGPLTCKVTSDPAHPRWEHG
jgi:hypothetical protein